MKIGVACITYNRPQMLGRVLRCFEMQTYQNREMVVLDDGAQYPDQPCGDRWRVISHGDRYGSLGEKRRVCIDLLTRCDAIAIFDDDDLYWPWALAAVADSLAYAPWSQAGEAYEWDGATMTRIQTYSLNPTDWRRSHHGAWAYRMNAYRNAGGYIEHDEDNDLQTRMHAMFGPSADSISLDYPEPFYVYSRETNTNHISHAYSDEHSYERAWKQFGQVKLQPTKLQVGWDRDYLMIPRPSVASPRPW